MIITIVPIFAESPPAPSFKFLAIVLQLQKSTGIPLGSWANREQGLSFTIPDNSQFDFSKQVWRFCEAHGSKYNVLKIF